MARNQRLGGYSASTVPSVEHAKYHGLLVAAMSPPVRRMVLLSRVRRRHPRQAGRTTGG